jgi:hypothetical protein
MSSAWLRSGALKSTNHSPRIFPDYRVRPTELRYEHDDVFVNAGKC